MVSLSGLPRFQRLQPLTNLEALSATQELVDPFQHLAEEKTKAEKEEGESVIRRLCLFLCCCRVFFVYFLSNVVLFLPNLSCNKFIKRLKSEKQTKDEARHLKLRILPELEYSELTIEGAAGKTVGFCL